MVVFEKCDPKSGLQCKNDAEIEQWLSGKYIFTIVNERKFIQQNFEGESYMQKNSRVKWYATNGNMRVDYANMVQTLDIDINDSVWPWPFNSNEENDGFTIERLNTREMPYNNLMMNAVTYEMSWDRH